MNRNQLIVGTSISLEKGENGRIWELFAFSTLYSCCQHLVCLCPTAPCSAPLTSGEPHSFSVWLMVHFILGWNFTLCICSVFPACEPGALSPSGASDIWSLGALVASGAYRWWAWVPPMESTETSSVTPGEKVLDSVFWFRHPQKAISMGLKHLSSALPSTEIVYLVVESRMTPRN